jgi:Na+/citrate or Na+/malate symporter
MALGSKPDPVMVNVKDWLAAGGVGEVAIPLIAGFDTTRLKPPEGVPE